MRGEQQVAGTILLERITDMSTGLDPLLSAHATAVTCAEAEQIGRAHFGMVARATVLSSERDGNFRMRADHGPDHLLRITNAAEAVTVTNLQTAALRHLEVSAPGLPVPRIVPSIQGTFETGVMLSDRRRHIVRLMTFLPGRPLRGTQDPVRLRSSVAGILAELDLGLRDFEHPAADHDLLWDAARASRVRPLLGAIADTDRRALASHALDEYEAYAVPRLPALRTQVIHNDFNPDNILVSEDGAPGISGIVDFGDLIRAPLVSDLATAAAYQPIDGGSALEALSEFAAAYHKKLPLTATELDVLLDLVRARQVIVAAITEWRAVRQPHNRSYILRNNPHAWNCLEQFVAVPRSAAQQALHRACGVE